MMTALSTKMKYRLSMTLPKLNKNLFSGRRHQSIRLSETFSLQNLSKYLKDNIDVNGSIIDKEILHQPRRFDDQIKVGRSKNFPKSHLEIESLLSIFVSIQKSSKEYDLDTLDFSEEKLLYERYSIKDLLSCISTFKKLRNDKDAFHIFLKDQNSYLKDSFYDETCTKLFRSTYDRIKEYVLVSKFSLHHIEVILVKILVPIIS